MAFLRQIAYFIIKKLNLIRGKIHQNDRSGGLYRAWGYIFSNHIEGDYVEFGVYKGESAVSAIESYSEFYNWLQLQQHDNENWRRELSKSSPLNKKPFFHLLDTFEGMPKNNEHPIIFKQNSFLSDFEKVKKKISFKNNLNIIINFYKGTFKEKTLELQKSLKNKKIAILNIDCDLMESTVDALNAVKSNIDIGTIILFDDYNQFKAHNEEGQRKAFRFFQNNSKFIFEKFYSYGFVGQSFLVVGQK